MTRDEIEKLTAAAQQWVKESDAAGVPNTAKTERAILRLLEERDRLLEALLIEPHCCGQAGVREDRERVDAAIAFAVAPMNKQEK